MNEGSAISADDVDRADVRRRIIVDKRGLDAGSLDLIRMLLLADALRRTTEDLVGGHLLLARLEDENRSPAARSTPHQSLGIRDPRSPLP